MMKSLQKTEAWWKILTLRGSTGGYCKTVMHWFISLRYCIIYSQTKQHTYAQVVSSCSTMCGFCWDTSVIIDASISSKLVLICSGLHLFYMIFACVYIKFFCFQTDSAWLPVTTKVVSYSAPCEYFLHHDGLAHIQYISISQKNIFQSPVGR